MALHAFSLTSNGKWRSVKIIEVDKKTNKLRLSRKALMEKPEGYVERPAAPRPPRDDRRDDRRGGGRDDRRGGSGGGGGYNRR